MATSSAYRGGSIWSMTAGSNETLGSGGLLLNHNFTELYDLVRPTSQEYNAGIVNVATTSDKYSNTYHYAKTLNVPDPTIASLTTSSAYVPVLTYGPNEVTWKPYVSDTGNGGGTTNSESASRLVAPANISCSKYNYQTSPSSGWVATSGTMSSYVQTYRSAEGSNSVTVRIPSFGAWMVTGTIFVSKTSWSDEYGHGRLYRVVICGIDSTIDGNGTSIEVYQRSTNSGWATSYGLLNTSLSSNQLTISDWAGSSGEGGSCIVYDLTVAGGHDLQMHASSGSGTDFGSGWS